MIHVIFHASREIFWSLIFFKNCHGANILPMVNINTALFLTTDTTFVLHNLYPNMLRFQKRKRLYYSVMLEIMLTLHNCFPFPFSIVFRDNQSKYFIDVDRQATSMSNVKICNRIFPLNFRKYIIKMYE